MQKMSGCGTAFLEIDGLAVEYYLQEGQRMVLETGHLAMMDASCSIDIRAIKGIKNVVFGGENFFNTIVTGPGKIIVQTMPMSHFAGAIARLMPNNN